MPPMPEAVSQFGVIRALWQTLHNQNLLPSTFVNRELAAFPAEHWQAFLQSKGADIIDKEYVALAPCSQMCSETHRRRKSSLSD